MYTPLNGMGVKNNLVFNWDKCWLEWPEGVLEIMSPLYKGWHSGKAFSVHLSVTFLCCISTRIKWPNLMWVCAWLGLHTSGLDLFSRLRGSNLSISYFKKGDLMCFILKTIPICWYSDPHGQSSLMNIGYFDLHFKVTVVTYNIICVLACEHVPLWQTSGTILTYRYMMCVCEYMA